jgi:DNA polymerase-3 subunit epsilon
MNEALYQQLAKDSDYQISRLVPTTFAKRPCSDSTFFIATIIDTETMGLDAKEHEIIELGLLSFSFSKTDGILEVIETYNELNDPGRPIPEEVTKVTGIKDEDVKGKTIDWDFVVNHLKQSHLIICHNSSFDRNFLELQTPEAVQALIKNRPFACTIKDIDWKERGIESAKLDYLNWKLGYFYKGHRAINDCWATFNLFIQTEGAFEELKANVRKKETLLSATNAPFDKKDCLKARNYRWADGSGALPKGWYTYVANDNLADEKQWLDNEIYGKLGASNTLPQMEITARTRYSHRAETMA